MTFMEAWFGLSLQGRGLFKSRELRIENLSVPSWLAVNLRKRERKWTGNHTHHLEALPFPASGLLALGEDGVRGSGDLDGTGRTPSTYNRSYSTRAWWWVAAESGPRGPASCSRLPHRGTPTGCGAVAGHPGFGEGHPWGWLRTSQRRAGGGGLSAR